MKILDTLQSIGSYRGDAPAPDAPDDSADLRADDGADVTTPLTVARQAHDAVGVKWRALEAAIAVTEQARADIAHRRAREEAVVDRQTTAQLYDGGPEASLAALLACETADAEQRARLASLLRQREVLAVERRTTERLVLEAERDEAEAENAARRREIDELTSRIENLARERQDLIHRAGWFDINRRPSLERRLGELCRPGGSTGRE